MSCPKCGRDTRHGHREHKLVERAITWAVADTDAMPPSFTDPIKTIMVSYVYDPRLDKLVEVGNTGPKNSGYVPLR